MRTPPHSKSTVSTLIERLKHKHQQVVLSAICALGRMGPAIKKVIWGMIQSMSQIDRESEDRTLVNAVRRIGMHSIPPLIEVLNHDNQKVKILACHRLSQFGLQAKSSVPVQEELFRAEDELFQNAAGSAIERIADHY